MDGEHRNRSYICWHFSVGGPVRCLAKKHFRHKTQKLSFKLLTWLAAIAHLFGFMAFLYFWIRS